RQDLSGGAAVVDVGDLGQDVVSPEDIAPGSLGDELPRRLGAEELHEGRDPLLTGGLRDVGRRLDAEDGDVRGHEVLEQVAVIAADLDDLALAPERKTVQ